MKGPFPGTHVSKLGLQTSQGDPLRSKKWVQKGPITSFGREPEGSKLLGHPVCSPSSAYPTSLIVFACDELDGCDDDLLTVALACVTVFAFLATFLALANLSFGHGLPSDHHRVCSRVMRSS